ncbi:Haloacid dehalogenase-like hydrolase domain-containing protein [Ananas comosus]|uniref:Haloacid dehalogenase-like hydrolase domain-containing protein n=1 Tax=Ananas comosus TaxID=4615 RepID=A0A199VL02_ANACO|nr:Haloacid dehalogenase-like hydrolase domain-containing protein [Ananas comosus]
MLIASWRSAFGEKQFSGESRSPRPARSFPHKTAAPRPPLAPSPAPIMPSFLPRLTRVLLPSSSLRPLLRSLRSSTMAAAAAGGTRARLRGVVFDMDGTLTVPVIDFPAMYREVLGDEAYDAAKRAGGGVVDILHHIEAWPPAEQRRAYEVIVPISSSRASIASRSCPELCEFLDSRRIRRGLITRNVKAAVDLFHQRFGMKFTPALSREFRPYKPDPAPLLHICSTWGLPPNEVMMIGDSLKDDIVCGKRAGAFTCLLDEAVRYGSLETVCNDLKPDFKVSSLSEVFSVLETHFDLMQQAEAA